MFISLMQFYNLDIPRYVQEPVSYTDKSEPNSENSHFESAHHVHSFEDSNSLFAKRSFRRKKF